MIGRNVKIALLLVPLVAIGYLAISGGGEEDSDAIGITGRDAAIDPIAATGDGAVTEPREAPRSSESAPAKAASAGAAPTEPSPRAGELSLPEPPAGSGLVMPNGQRVPCLNGVDGEFVLRWPRGRPFAPIVAVETTDTGLAWYVHQDGTRSTTQWMQKPDGSREGVGSVASPVDGKTTR